MRVALLGLLLEWYIWKSTEKTITEFANLTERNTIIS